MKPSATAVPPVPPAADVRRREWHGLLLGLAGVVMFALTLPMTRLAVGAASTPQLPPLFVTAGRAAGAGLLGLAYLLWVRAPWPRADRWRSYAASALGTVFGFPLFIALALREVPAMHAAVVSGVLPLATAAVAAVVLRQRPSPAFWACALLGCALVLGFAAWRGGGHWVAADGHLLLAVASAAVGYVAGARLAGERPAEEVVSWCLVLSLPFTLPLAAWSAPPLAGWGRIAAPAWGGFAYVTLVSMWLGFFAWYRGLALGGTLRVSQVQLLQPFLALLFAVPVAGERLDAATLFFALAVLATVAMSRRTAVPTSAAGAARAAGTTPDPPRSRHR